MRAKWEQSTTTGSTPLPASSAAFVTRDCSRSMLMKRAPVRGHTTTCGGSPSSGCRERERPVTRGRRKRRLARNKGLTHLEVREDLDLGVGLKHEQDRKVDRHAQHDAVLQLPEDAHQERDPEYHLVQPARAPDRDHHLVLDHEDHGADDDGGEGRLRDESEGGVGRG